MRLAFPVTFSLRSIASIAALSVLVTAPAAIADARQPTPQPQPRPAEGQPAPATPVPATPASTPPAAPSGQSGPAPAAAANTGAPRLPPFAGTVISFDRRGDRVVACVDRSTVPLRPGSPAPPTGIKLPPAYRIWLIEREVMQELMTTGGLCHPVWAPDGKTFLAAGARGLFTFTAPQYEARVLTALLPPPQVAVTRDTANPTASGEKPGTPPAATPGAAPPAAAPAGQPAAPPAGPPPGAATVKTTDGAPIPFSQTSWSPGGGRIAFLLTAPDGAAKVRVIDAKDGTSIFSRDFTANRAAKLVQWGPTDRTLVIDGTRVPLP
jgi:hypothetical protein